MLLDLDRPVASDETVTLTYLAPAMHPIRDTAGRPAPPLANEPVRNETGVSDPATEAGRTTGAATAASLEAVLEAAQQGAGTERPRPVVAQT